MSQEHKPAGAAIKRRVKRCFSRSQTARAGIRLEHRAVGVAQQRMAVTAGLTIPLLSSNSSTDSLFPEVPFIFSFLLLPLVLYTVATTFRAILLVTFHLFTFSGGYS